MTTTVTVLVQGNKACEVKIAKPGCPDDEVTIIEPNTFTTRLVYDDRQVVVTEVGPFLS